MKSWNVQVFCEGRCVPLEQPVFAGSNPGVVANRAIRAARKGGGKAWRRNPQTVSVRLTAITSPKI